MTGPRRSTFGIVTLASLDVRRKPDHASEMGSQLLMGEVVRVLRRGAGERWFLVENLADGYRGWVRTWGLALPPPRRLAAWRRRAVARPAQLWVEVREAPGRGEVVTPLFWGARVIPGRVQGRFRRVELPDGSRGWVPARALAPGPRAVPTLRERVGGLMGVPYLWGGRTPAGLDCSGLAGLLLAERGCRIPRDAGDQERACRPLGPHEAPRPGDLVFFGAPGAPASHVGVMLGGGAYVHARGRVRVNNLDSSNKLYDNELGSQFKRIGRPRASGRGAA